MLSLPMRLIEHPPRHKVRYFEAMQERQLTVCGQTYELPDPFFVLATQNPVETEGTYPLPEAQLDRFLLKIHVPYPTRSEEREIARRQTTDYRFDTKPVLDVDQIHAMQSLVRSVVVSDPVYEAALDLVRGTRTDEGSMSTELQKFGSVGSRATSDDFIAVSRKGSSAAKPTMSCDNRGPGCRGDPGASAPNHTYIQCRGGGHRCRHRA